MRNKHSCFKDFHIQNDENVFFWFIYLIFIYFLQNKKKNIWNKRKANKSARIWEEKEKAIEQTGTRVLVFFFFIYVQDKFIHLIFFLKTHSTKKKKKEKKSLTKKKKKQKTKQNQKQPIVQFCPLFNVAGFLITGDRWWWWLGGASKRKLKHTGRRTGCLSASEIILLQNRWELYSTLI